MKKNITLSIFSFFCSVIGFSQTQFQKDYEAVRTELVNWDAVRGEWLANSFEAMAYKQSVPDRTFPEDLTPNELFHLVPKSTKKNIENIVVENSNRAKETSQKDAWRKIAIYTETGLCKPVSARSYGDPHLSSFDGGSFSFQTVGEFVMTKSQSGHMEVQARQGAQSDNFSLNSAIAMNVVGDRFCVYPNRKPDNDNSTPFRLNGNPIRLEDKTYNLPHGGTIVKTGKNDYVVNWPTGERVIFDIKNSAQFDFINLTIEILPCLDERFDGVLGNANNNVSDDFKTRTGFTPPPNFVSFVTTGNEDANRVSQDLEKEHLAFIAKDFANEWRVNNENTLFDYGFGENTLTYTDLSFPRVHRTVEDLTPAQRTTAQRQCEEAGIRGSDLRGCIYDRGFLDIPANPKPVVVDRGTGLVLAKIEKPVSTTGTTKETGKVTKEAEIETDLEHPTKIQNSNTEKDVDPVIQTKKSTGNTEKNTGKTVKTEEEKPASSGSLFGGFKSTKSTKSSESSSPTEKTSPKVTSPTQHTETPHKETKPTTFPVSKPSTPVSTPVTKPSTPVSSPVKKGRG